MNYLTVLQEQLPAPQKQSTLIGVVYSKSNHNITLTHFNGLIKLLQFSMNRIVYFSVCSNNYSISARTDLKVFI